MYLLDTYTLLWFLQNDNHLSHEVCEIIETSDVMVSVASLWEIAIKNSLGKLILPKPFCDIFPKQLQMNDIDILAIDVKHLNKVNELEFLHRDLFDRLIIAQALTNNLTLISKDTQFGQYGVNLLW